MHATVYLLHAGQWRRASDAAKSGQFIGQFTWVTGDPIGLKGLTMGDMNRFCIQCMSDIETHQISILTVQDLMSIL